MANRTRELLDAARRLLDARENQMVTSAEWAALETAVDAFAAPPARGESFSVAKDGALVRSVVPAKGEPYQHRCELSTFEAVAHAAEEAAGEGFTLEEIADAEGLPSSQVAAAIAFLKERGCVTTEGRRSYGRGPGVHIDAMTEYHALREGA
ncbi:MAG: hypothetical protein IPJ41_14690 [Phycisphaerales bacterium]|nr:hypothetical protein [Phycisphaerales bacterium]